MKYCSHCGNQLMDQAVFCPKCGCAVGGVPMQQPTVNDAPSAGMAVLAFFFPIIGLVLYLVWKDEKPRKAKSAGQGALIGFIVSIVLSIVTYVAAFAMIDVIFTDVVDILDVVYF